MKPRYCMEPAAGEAGRTRNYDMRERILRDGPRSLSDRELLAVVLGSGCAGRSVAALATDVQSIIDQGTPDLNLILLEQLSGMGSAKVCSIAAAMELGRRYYAIRDSRITMPKDVFPLISHFADRKQEYFICISLNGAHEVISARRVTQGLVNRTVVISCFILPFSLYLFFLIFIFLYFNILSSFLLSSIIYWVLEVLNG